MSESKTKLTVYLSKEVIKRAKHYALDQDKSLSELIEELLAEKAR